MLASEQALERGDSHEIWVDMLGFAGIEMHRRILGLAHNADFETIADPDLRAAASARRCSFGRQIAVNRSHIHCDRGGQRTGRLIEKEHRRMKVGARHYRHHLAEPGRAFGRYHRPALAAA